VSTAQCPLLAQSGHRSLHRTCPLSGVKRKFGVYGTIALDQCAGQSPWL
jgi:hypothetical protein